MDLDMLYPALSDLRKKAKRRMPSFAFEYLDSGTGTEKGVTRNRAALDNVLLMPAILKGEMTFDVSREVLGHRFDTPFGIAPIGFSGIIWPGAEELLAQGAVRANIPYCQSTVAIASPEENAPNIGQNGWFQHYPVNDPEIRRDMISRIKAAGFKELIITVDVPGESRRERQRRAHISVPPKITPKIALELMLKPQWCLGMAPRGTPRMSFPDSYIDQNDPDSFVHAGRLIRGNPDWDYISACQEDWGKPVIVKGVGEPDDAMRLKSLGVAGIWVSNHTGRQFEGGPGAIDLLPPIRDAIGSDTTVFFDSGVQGGLDILRALALGADFVFLGRAFHYAVGALGKRGVDHLVHMLRSDIEANMSQLGIQTFDELPDRLV